MTRCSQFYCRYGGRSTVSAITLAVMEDLGFYLGNYTAAGCMAWGHGEGCEFVKYRCAKRGGANSTAAADAEDCKGSPAWLTKPDAQVEAHCIGGIDPCANAAGGGYDAATGTCSLMCHTEGANACVQVQPEGEVEGSRVSKFLDRVQEVSWQQWVWLAVYIVGGASATAVHLRRPLLTMRHRRAHLSPLSVVRAGVLTVILFKRICCPPGGRRVVLASVSALLMLTGLIVGVIVIVAITGVDVSAIAALQVTTGRHRHLHSTTSPPPPPPHLLHLPPLQTAAVELERIIGADALRIVAGIAFTLFGIGFITELAIFMKSPITLAVVGLLWALMMALELAVTGVTIYWIVSLDSLANDQMLTLQVTTGRHRHHHHHSQQHRRRSAPHTASLRSTSAGQVRRAARGARGLAAPEPRRGRRVPHVPGVLPRPQARRHRCDVVGQRHRLDGELSPAPALPPAARRRFRRAHRPAAASLVTPECARAFRHAARAAPFPPPPPLTPRAPHPSQAAPEAASGEAGSGSAITLSDDHTRTCLVAHEGTTTDLLVGSEDPSNPQFCEFISGVEKAEVDLGLDTAICTLLDAVIEPNAAQCQVRRAAQFRASRRKSAQFSDAAAASSTLPGRLLPEGDRGVLHVRAGRRRIPALGVDGDRLLARRDHHRRAHRHLQHRAAAHEDHR